MELNTAASGSRLDPPPPAAAGASTPAPPPTLSPAQSDWFSQTQDDLRSEDVKQRLRGLARLVDARFSDLPPEAQRVLAEIAVANADGGSIHDPDDLAVSTNTAVVILQKAKAGDLPGSMLVMDAYQSLVGSLDAAKIDDDAIQSFAAHRYNAGLSGVLARIQNDGFDHPWLRAEVSAFSLKGGSFADVAASVHRLRQNDPIPIEVSAPEGGTAASADAPSRFEPSSHSGAATPPPGSMPVASPFVARTGHAGIDSAVSLVGMISNQMNALIAQLQTLDSSFNEAELAEINAQMKRLQGQMDIALGLLDQVTRMFEKVGQSFNR